jgi:hypothetical protein
MAEETDDQCYLVGFNTQELRMVSGQLEEQLTGQRHLAGLISTQGSTWSR